MVNEHDGASIREEKVVDNEIASCAPPAASVDLNQGDDAVRDNRNEAVKAATDTELIERYSVFTVPQKRAIILSSSSVGLLSYMSSSIYYPAVNQARISFTVYMHF